MDAFWHWLLVAVWEPFWCFFLNGFCVNLVRPLVVFVPLVIIFGKGGRSFGLPQLFRRESGYDRFFIGMGVGVLIWQAVLAGYLFEEFATNYTFDRPPFCEWRTLESAAPDSTSRFRLPPAAVSSILWYAGSVALGAGFSVVILGGPFVLVRRVVMAIERRRNPEPPAAVAPNPAADRLEKLPGLPLLVVGMAVGFLFMTTAAWLLLPGRGTQPGWLASADEWVGANAGATREPLRGALRDIGRCAVDTAGYGRAAGRGARWEEFRKNPHATEDERRAAITKARDAGEKTQADARKGYEPYFPVYGLFLVGVSLAFAVFAWLAADPAYRLLRLGRPTFSPVAGLVFLLHLALFVQTVADYFIPVPQLVYVGLVLLTVVFARRYKLRHPNVLPADQPQLRGLEEHYKKVADEYEARLNGTPPPPPPATPATPVRKPPLFNRQLGMWNEGQKRPLVLVCASGGGSRAAAWTMKVLTELERRIEGKKSWPFPYHIRVVAGASGGIIGSAYYVSTLDPPSGDRPPAHRYLADEVKKGKRVRPAELTLGELNHTVRGDFLTSVVHTMLTRDLPGLFLPRFLPPLAGYDRGQALEWAWQTMLHRDADSYREHGRRPSAARGGLTHTFDDLWDGEKAGWRPSLVFSPMTVEDGRQLLISNLDLMEVIHNTGDSLDPSQPGQLISREAVEFFRLFPDATGFRVGTAARMSGSFPYVLPAVPLPTHPRRRVVDAGYYDNYGVGVAASWLFNNLDWVEQVASRVAIVQIRDGLSTADRLMTRPTDEPPTAVELGTEWLTTPPAGQYQARASGNVLRNDNLLHLLHQRMRQRFDGRMPFVTPAFELPAGGDVSLSYTLTEAEKKLIDDCLPGSERRPTSQTLAREVDALEERVARFVEWFTA